jgi:DNA-binding NtrC family response regulator
VGFTPEALAVMAVHPWPGNVRELEHAVERAVLLASEDAPIGPTDLLLRPVAEGSGRLEDMTLDEVERYLIRRALDRHEGNVSRAADALGLSRSALYRRLQQHDLTP